MKNLRNIALIVCGLCTVATSTGCGFQTRVAGQTLPSAFYLRDDVQYFYAGEETQLSNLRSELARYKVEQQEGGDNEAP